MWKRIQLTVACAIIVMLSAGIPASSRAHCEHCFAPAPEKLLAETAVRQKFEAIKSEYEHSSGQNFNSLARSGGEEFVRALRGIPSVVGSYRSREHAIVIIEDDNHNMYSLIIPPAPVDGSEEAILIGYELPSLFDGLMASDLPAAPEYSTLRVLDLGDGGVTFFANVYGNDEPLHFVLPKIDRATLAKGKPLAANQNSEFTKWLTRVGLQTGSPVVVWADPFIQFGGKREAEVMNLVTGLRQAYPRSCIVLDDPSEDLGGRIKMIVGLSAVEKREGDQAHANIIVVCDKTEQAKDFGLTTAYSENLTKAGVDVIAVASNSTYRGKRGVGVVVLTAHSDERLNAFVARLCEGHFLEGNLVIVNSCGTPNTKAVIDRILHKCGAEAAFALLGRPTVSQMKAMLHGLTTGLERAEPGRHKLYDVYHEALAAAEIRGMWQVSGKK